MALIKINGTPLAELGGTLNRPTLEVNRSLSEIDTATFTISGHKPAPLSEVEVWNSAGTVKRFGGVLMAPQGDRVGRGRDFEVDYACEAVGFAHLLERHLLTYRFAAQKAGSAVREALAQYDADIDTSNVQDGPDLPAFAWTDYPKTLLEKLADLTGYQWRVDGDKRLYFEPRGYRRAPADLTDTSCNFADLSITYDAKTIRNAVEVRGGMVPSPQTVTDTFTGDGMTANFKLSFDPYSTDKNPLLQDRFSPTRDYHPAPHMWHEYDTFNPNPPNQPDPGKPPITGTDGYLIVDNANFELSACQIVGGPGAWGQVGLLSKAGYHRQEDRYLYATFLVHAAGDGIIGWFDGLGVEPSDCLYGLRLEADGSLHAQVGGERVALTGKAYATATSYSVRLTLKVAGGVRMEIIGGDYGLWSGRAWTTLLDTDAGTAPTLYAGAAGCSLNVSIFEMRVADPVLGIVVTVNGSRLVLGLDGVDTSQVDAVVDPTGQLLRIESSIAPPERAAIEVTYRRPVPIRVYATDGDAIRALASLTGETGPKAGRREFRIVDDTITSFDEARARAAQELREYANPIVTATWSTEDEGYDAGQTIRIAVSNHGEDREFLIQEVHGGHFNGDWWEYQITAGSTLKGINDYLAKLVQDGRRVLWSENEPLEFMVAGEDRVAVAEQLIKLTTVPDVSGADSITITESLDELGYGPLPPYRYDDPNTKWGRCTYAE